MNILNRMNAALRATMLCAAQGRLATPSLKASATYCELSHDYLHCQVVICHLCYNDIIVHWVLKCVRKHASETPCQPKCLFFNPPLRHTGKKTWFFFMRFNLWRCHHLRCSGRKCHIFNWSRSVALWVRWLSEPEWTLLIKRQQSGAFGSESREQHCVY